MRFIIIPTTGKPYLLGCSFDEVKKFIGENTKMIIDLYSNKYTTNGEKWEYLEQPFN